MKIVFKDEVGAIYHASDRLKHNIDIVVSSALRKNRLPQTNVLLNRERTPPSIFPYLFERANQYFGRPLQNGGPPSPDIIYYMLQNRDELILASNNQREISTTTTKTTTTTTTTSTSNNNSHNNRRRNKSENSIIMEVGSRKLRKK